MNDFRMKRVLRLREKEARLLEIEWAERERRAHEADELLDATERAIEDGIQATRALPSGDLEAVDHVQRVLAAYERLDALRERVRHVRGRVAAARAAADEARGPYDERRRDVEALRRLEDRWRTSVRAQRRRADDRAREEALNALRAIDSSLARRTSTTQDLHGERPS